MSWEQYAAIARLARDEYAQSMARLPIDCPNDGQPLQTGPDGVLFCTFDGWRDSGTWHDN